jgi:hypothetical protein
MGSFTDAITQFNPYVAQLPVDAMVKVGMLKQQQYEQGVEKIQSQIDQVAGLDIMKDVHKKYLQSKLDELGGNLRTFAAGDFSNFQLVNSVAGMTKQVGKDPIIQNAVSSTVRAKKQNQLLEAAKKEGKSSVQNEALYNYQQNEWLNDGKLDTPFSGEYVQYTDMTKKFTDIFKDLGAKDQIIQDPFYRDGQGRFTDEKGNILPPGANPVPNIVMLEKTLKGRSPQAIKNAIMASINENDIRQLKIDSWYHYKDYSKNNLTDSAYNNQVEDLTKLKQQMDALEQLKSLNPKNIQYQNSILDQIKEVEKDYAETVNFYKSKFDLIDKDPEQYKYEMYTKNTINQFATNMSDFSETVKYVNSPYQEYFEKIRNYNLAVDRYKEEIRSHKASENMAYLNYELSVAKEQREIRKEQREEQEKLVGSGLLNRGGLDQTTINDITEKDYLGLFSEELTNSKNDLTKAKTNFRKNYFSNKSETEFDKDYAFHLKAYNDGTETSKTWVKFFDDHIDLENEYNSNAALLKSIQDEADRKFPTPKAAKVVSGQPEFAGGFFGLEEGPLKPMSKREQLLLQKQQPNVAEKVNFINSELSKKLVEKLQPRSYSFNLAKPEQRQFVSGQVAQLLYRIKSGKGVQEEDALTKGSNLTNLMQLNDGSNTKYFVTSQGNDVYITLQGLINGKIPSSQTVKLSSKDYSDLFSQSITSPYQRASNVIFQNGNTNIQSGIKNAGIVDDKNAYKTAYFQKIRGGSSRDAFPNINKYTVKADIFRLPGADGSPSGEYQSLFYIKNVDGSGNVEWKPYQGPSSPYLTSLIQSFNLMDDNTLQNTFQLK